MVLDRGHLHLGDGVDELGRRAEMRHVFGRREIEEDVAAAQEGRAVEEQQRRLRGERAHEPVPHHPAAGGEVEDAIPGLHVAMQQVLLQVHQQDAARAVHDALGHARCAARVEDVERVVERHRAVGDRRGRVPLDEARERDAAIHRGGIGLLAHVRHDHDLPHGRELLTISAMRQRVDNLALSMPVAAERTWALPGLAVGTPDAKSGMARGPGAPAPWRDREHGSGMLAEARHASPSPTPAARALLVRDQVVHSDRVRGGAPVSPRRRPRHCSTRVPRRFSRSETCSGRSARRASVRRRRASAPARLAITAQVQTGPRISRSRRPGMQA